MALNINELQPKPFTVKVGKQETECKPPRMSHLFIINKMSPVFSDPAAASVKDIKEAEEAIDDVIADLIPELAGVQLDFQDTVDLLTQIAENVTPADNKELVEKGVTFDSQSPKAEIAG